ncbi:unnamed protein product [Amaranthus hypochondriacus]
MNRWKIPRLANNANRNVRSNQESNQSNNVVEQQNINIYPPNLQDNLGFYRTFLDSFPRPNLDNYPPNVLDSTDYDPGFLDALPHPSLLYPQNSQCSTGFFDPRFFYALPDPNLLNYPQNFQGNPGFDPGYLDACYLQWAPMGIPGSPCFVPGGPPMGFPGIPCFVPERPPMGLPVSSSSGPSTSSSAFVPVKITKPASSSYVVKEPEPSDHPVLKHLPENFDITNNRARQLEADINNLSLEERTGGKRSGLKEETITKLLKRRKYKYVRGEREREVLSDAQECLKCKEYYVDGQEIGKIQCGHEFHAECIKKVLLSFNECPICCDIGFNV